MPSLSPAEHKVLISINAHTNCCLKLSIKSPLSDAAMLQYKFTHIGDIKSEEIH